MSRWVSKRHGWDHSRSVLVRPGSGSIQVRAHLLEVRLPPPEPRTWGSGSKGSVRVQLNFATALSGSGLWVLCIYLIHILVLQPLCSREIMPSSIEFSSNYSIDRTSPDGISIMVLIYGPNLVSCSLCTTLSLTRTFAAFQHHYNSMAVAMLAPVIRLPMPLHPGHLNNPLNSFNTTLSHQPR